MRRTGVVIVSVMALLSWSARVDAQVHVGPQLSVGTDSGLGLGGRIVFPLRTGALGVDGLIDGNYFFGGGRAVDSWIDTNANVRVPVPLTEDFITRVGAGVNFSFISFEDTGVTTRTDTQAGLNLLATIEIPRGNNAPYLELRVVVGGDEQLVLTGGITFGPRR